MTKEFIVSAKMGIQDLFQMDLGTLSLRRGYLCRRCLVIFVAYTALMALFGVALNSNSHNNKNSLNEGNFVHQFFGSFDASDLNVSFWI